MQAVIGILAALPQLVSLATEIWAYLQKVSGNDPAGYLLKLGNAFALLNSAQSEADHAAAAKALADALAHSAPK